MFVCSISCGRGLSRGGRTPRVSSGDRMNCVCMCERKREGEREGGREGAREEGRKIERETETERGGGEGSGMGKEFIIF